MDQIDEMKRLIEKFWFFTAALCLAATLLAFGAVVGDREVCEETTSEKVEMGEIEAVAERRKRRPLLKDQSVGRFVTSLLKATKNPNVTCVRVTCKSFAPSSERDYLNGNGVYLQI